MGFILFRLFTDQLDRSMCGSLEQLSTKATIPSSSEETETMDCLTGVVGSEYSFSVLLEFAADNDVEGFRRSLTTCDVSLVGEVGLWYGRQKCSKHIVVEHRTPLMIAAKYGSVEFVKLILSLSEVDVNLFCGPDKSTALHCAASGGSVRAVEVVRLLLHAGADPCVIDANGHRPFDVIAAPWNMPQIKVALEELLNSDGPVCLEDVQESAVNFRSGSSSSLSSSLDSGFSSLVSDANISVVTCKPTDNTVSSAPERKEYPVDPSIPDIKSSIYGTDEFRMFSFKIRPCSRAYSHDWTECPFVHPGENARRRDPRKFHYCGVPCPDFRKGTCKRGDLCEYAHGVFESWLHPAQYRTRLCKDGTTCNRRVCFFAHRPEELRPLYVSSGSGIQSPQSTASSVSTMDKTAVMNFLPGSPSLLSAVSMSPFSPTISPSASVITQAPIGWPQQHIPTLHLPGSNIQASRLRSSLNAGDMPTMELNMSQDFEMYQPQHLLDGIFSNGVSSPRCLDQVTAMPILSSAHKSVLLNQLHQQQRVLSPMKTNIFSPKNDHLLFQSAFDASLSERTLPWNVEPLSPLNSQLSAFADIEKQHQSFRSLSSRELGYKLSDDLEPKDVVGSPVNSWSKRETPNDKLDWPVQEDELGQFRNSCSTRPHGVEPAVSWAQSLVKQSPSVQTTAAAASMTVSVEGSNSNSSSELSDNAIFLAWHEQLQIDKIMA
ncbi:zinc finger CCCH domain-containing protein 56-like [Durio zibethinus]|uniref:Zinc finger CCCH domain-containing protein 56-like n=1 Tax=Durio zibethinus TaxID=66656 RepID=A0A6P5ZMD8_DURZI|nr:zinc finger CCCH domain-containing protein 56-like [Durio zibethinus]